MSGSWPLAVRTACWLNLLASLIGTRAPGVVGEQLVQLGLEQGVGLRPAEFLLELQQCGVERLRNESAAEPIEMTGGVRQ